MKKFVSEFSSIEELFKKLENPENKYRIYPIHHELCDKNSDFKKTVDNVSLSGAGGVVTNTTWQDEKWVFNRENTEKLNNAVKYIKSKGLSVWMYDDYYYPSGLANGYAVKDKPENFAKNLVYTADGSVKIQNNIEEITVGKAKGHLDHLSKSAVDAFIDNALKTVNEVCPLENIDAVFTDEPTLASHVLSFKRGKVDFSKMPVPYCDKLFDAYEKMWGEDLKENIKYLFTDLSKEAKTTRIKYYKTISTIAREDYIDNIREYLNSVGTLASGHFLLEEGLKYHVGYYGDYMRVVGGQDIPGCDILCADGQEFFKLGSGFHTSWAFAGKYPSSLSRLQGHNVTMMEICPVNYPEKVKIDPFKEIMAVSTFAIFAGITHYNAYGYYFIKDEEQHRILNNYVGRLLTVLRNAKPESTVAVYYPISAMQEYFATPTPEKEGEVDFYEEAENLENKMEKLLYALYDAHTDFNIISEDFFIEDKWGIVKSDILLVPFMEFLSEKEICALKNYKGKVIFVDRKPEFDLSGNEISLNFPVITSDEIKDIEGIRPQMSFTVTGENIYASPYSILGKKFLYVINKKEEDTVISLSGDFMIYEPEKNKTYFENSFNLKGERGILIFER